MRSLFRFIGTYWKEVTLAGLLFAVSFFWWQDHKGLVDAYDASVESYETRLKELKESHQRETERKAEALEEYKTKPSGSDRLIFTSSTFLSDFLLSSSSIKSRRSASKR